MGNLLTSCEKLQDEKDVIEEVLTEDKQVNYLIIKTKAYDDQKPGTSGLRKKTKVFMQKNYLHNFIQSVFNVFDIDAIKNHSLLIASDGRYFSKDAIQIVCEIAAGNGITHIIIPKNGIASTPACSTIIRKRNHLIHFENLRKEPTEKNKQTISIDDTETEKETAVAVAEAEETKEATEEATKEEKCKISNNIEYDMNVEKNCFGGILLTASHNSGGEDGDFGIKINSSNGGPIAEELTNKIYEESKNINTFKIKKLKKIEYNEIKKEVIENITIEVIDPVIDWIHLMKYIFDFDLIKKITTHENFILAYDAFHGSTGEYTKELFFKELHVENKKFFFNLNSKPDFNKLHPDPNLVHAKKLVELMKVNEDEDEDEPNEDWEKKKKEIVIPDIAGVCDADGDRCMILGKRIFVNPCDNIAIIAHYASKCIPYFKSNFYGAARSLPTSTAIDRVMNTLEKPIFETPTGWKYFVNLMETSKISFCGEESFSAGCNLIREKDGLFILLCWLSILAYKNFVEHNETNRTELISVKEVVHEFWKEYGRCYYIRYDFEDVDIHRCDELFKFLANLTTDKSIIYKEIKELNCENENHKIHCVENFTYVDSVTQYVSKNEGIRIIFENGGSIIYRKSKTGTTNAIIRIYFHKLEKENLFSTSKKVLKDLIYIGLKICKIKEFAGTDVPTVIT